MRTTLTLTLLFTVLFSTSAQKFEKAIVTDVNFFRRTGIYINEETFPFYFQHTEFKKDVFSDIKKNIFINLGVEIEKIEMPDSIYYYEGAMQKTATLRSRAKAGKSNELFVCVETTLQEGVVVNDEIQYNFITKVKAVNNEGRKVYSFKNRIPFTVMLNETITSTAEMGEADFYAFYFDGLEMAFDKKIDRAEKRYIFKPPTKDYINFLNSSEQTLLKLDGKTYTLGVDSDNQNKVLNFYALSVDKGAKKLSYSNFDYTIWDRYLAINGFSNDTMLIKLRDGDNKWLLEYSDKHPVALEISFSDKNNAGYLESINDSTLTGRLNRKNYRIRWNSKNMVNEIYVEDELKYILNNIGDGRIIYLHNSFTDEELGDLITMVFVSDFMIALVKYRY